MNGTVAKVHWAIDILPLGIEQTRHPSRDEKGEEEGSQLVSFHRILSLLFNITHNKVEIL
jgi:hypothetical protein